MPEAQLRILGRTELSVSARKQSSDLRQPKRLALLAYLALTDANGFRRRDEMVRMFWPGQDQLHGRTQLRKALYAIRGVLGADALLTRGEEEVALDPARVWCDAAAFRRLCDAKEWQKALELYQGDLLHGLEPGGVGAAFQRWLEEQRNAIRYLAGRAQEASAAANGDRADGREQVAAAATPARDGQNPPVATRSRKRRRWMVATLAIVSVVLPLGAFAAGTRFELAPPLASIAVLPFNGFADPTAVMIGEGMAEELTAALTQVSGIGVRSSARSRESLRGAEDLREIGRRLKVAHLVDGSVQRSSQRLHVTIRLVRANDGMSLWAQTYDFRPSDPIEAQAEVARASVPALTPFLASRTP